MAPWTEYQQLFSHCGGEKYCLEATPGYFEGGLALAEAIRGRLGDQTRIIITLRDPADRLRSFFNYKKAQLELPDDISLPKYVELCLRLPIAERRKRENDRYWGVDGGKYIEYLPDWYSIFGPNNIKIVFFEELANDPRRVMSELCAWLGIDPSLYDGMEFTVENKTVQFRFAWLQCIAIQVNMRLEAGLRRAPWLKRAVRQLYYTMNGVKRISTAVDKDISRMFRDDNKALASFLLGQGYAALPDWLAGD